MTILSKADKKLINKKVKETFTDRDKLVSSLLDYLQSEKEKHEEYINLFKKEKPHNSMKQPFNNFINENKAVIKFINKLLLMLEKEIPDYEK